MTEMDRIPRYAPSVTYIVRNGFAGREPILRYIVHPPHAHPAACPLKPECCALELVTAHGSRWWSFERCWINSELRMVVQGFPASCKLRSKWEVCCEV